MNEYIEFKVIDSGRFKLLQQVFQKIKNDKDNDSLEDDEFYLDFFDEQARSNFNWYTADEIKNWERKWFSTPAETRWNDPNLKTKWIFESMIDSFKDGEYKLLSLEMIQMKQQD